MSKPKQKVLSTNAELHLLDSKRERVLDRIEHDGDQSSSDIQNDFDLNSQLYLEIVSTKKLKGVKMKRNSPSHKASRRKVHGLPTRESVLTLVPKKIDSQESARRHSSDGFGAKSGPAGVETDQDEYGALSLSYCHSKQQDRTEPQHLPRKNTIAQKFKQGLDEGKRQLARHQKEIIMAQHRQLKRQMHSKTSLNSIKVKSSHNQRQLAYHSNPKSSSPHHSKVTQLKNERVIRNYLNKSSEQIQHLRHSQDFSNLHGHPPSALSTSLDLIESAPASQPAESYTAQSGFGFKSRILESFGLKSGTSAGHAGDEAKLS